MSDMAEGDDDLVFPQNVRVPLSALHFEYSRGSGPGGQNVNKVNSRVTLRLDIQNAPFLRPEIRDLLLQKLATRIPTEGVLVLDSSEHRDQPRNREAAVARLATGTRPPPPASRPRGPAAG